MEKNNIMKNEKSKAVLEMEKLDKKNVWKVWVLFGIGAVVGIVMSKGMSSLESYAELEGMGLGEILKSVEMLLVKISMWVLPIMTVLVSVILGRRIAVHGREVHQWDGEDEDYVNRIETKLSVDVICVEAFQIVSFLLYGFAFSNAILKSGAFTETGKLSLNYTLLLADIICFVGFL